MSSQSYTGLGNVNPIRDASPPENAPQVLQTLVDNMSQQQVITRIAGDDKVEEAEVVEEEEEVRPSKKEKKHQQHLHKRPASPVENDDQLIQPPPSKWPRERKPKPPLPAPLQTRSAAM